MELCLLPQKLKYRNFTADTNLLRKEVDCGEEMMSQASDLQRDKAKVGQKQIPVQTNKKNRNQDLNWRKIA